MDQETKKKSILEKTSQFVTELFKEKLPAWAVYHDLSHTIDTVDGCIEIGKGSGLSEDEVETLCIAAWFHDTGYMFNHEEHEEKSSELAIDFLRKNNYPSDKTNTIIHCILATKLSIPPKNLLESIVCDSDLISLGGHDYFQKNDLLKLEFEKRENKKISELAWLKRSLLFLTSHNYFTEYARKTFGAQLETNIINLQKTIDEYH